MFYGLWVLTTLTGFVLEKSPLAHRHMMSREDAEVTHDEADITLVSYMLKAAENGAATIQIVSDENDVFVLLVY